VEEFFGTDGLIARNHRDYEYREGQVRMAEAVMRAFDDRRSLVVEAGTGTGKTLAYLIPAVAAALGRKQRVIISTGTKNLQEQLMEKDIPFLQRIMPKKFSAAYMKGRSNYACLYRINKAEDQPILDGMDDVAQFESVREWVFETQTGDRSELKDLPEGAGFWNRINARSEICLGQKCPEFEPCFITRMRERAENADIVIVNHHLFFADLAVRKNQFGRVLPEYGAVIFDEAHLVEDIAADYFGLQVSSFQIEELVRDTDKLPINDVTALRDLSKLGARVTGFADQFWIRFTETRAGDGRRPLSATAFAATDSDGELRATPLGEAYFILDSYLERLAVSVDGYSDESPEAESVSKRIKQVRADLDFIVRQTDENFVFWFERRGKGTFLRAAPIDVSSIMRDKLHDKVETVVMTSATISSNGKFDFIIRRLGLDADHTDTLVAHSAFDHEEQAMMYIPSAMPDPRAPEYNQLAAEEIVKILNVSNGRAFVLCTSNAAMNALYETVSLRVNFPCFVQGTMSKAGLLEKFRETPNSVLFATSSFWQGVDVQGEQLSCVIIDKLPFAVPTDPVISARTRQIEDAGGNSFFEYSVPQAVITLKQGIGRLIRSRGDRGIIAILDTRLRTKSYGRDFLASLPRMKVTSNISDLERVFED
jgi:ATP-dependent DNA helicase DinG